MGASTTGAAIGDTTSAPAPTDAPDTTTPPTDSAAPTSTLAPLTPGWVPLPVEELTGQVAPPCCASNWYGEPSPLLPADGGALADGDYYVRYKEWSTDPGAPLELELLRFLSARGFPHIAAASLRAVWTPARGVVRGG